MAQDASVVVNVLCAFIKKEANFKQASYHTTCTHADKKDADRMPAEHADKKDEQSGSPDAIFPQENDSLTTKDILFCDTQKRAFLTPF